MKDKYIDFFNYIIENGNEDKRESMESYMLNQFDFLGIQAKERRLLSGDFLKELKNNREIDWNFIELCWKNKYREFQYIAMDHLIDMEKYYELDGIYKIEELIVDKSWWDSVDRLSKAVGGISQKYEDLREKILSWSVADNIWLRRTAIIHQLKHKDKTDIELLEEIILNNLGSDEFFINKGIGWALREYSKTDSQWVREFIEKYKDKLSKLSITEGSKYI
ncbi:DNA alkylation repair protein [Anaerosphaera multitolerans]|uniref:DNA alkylation repair protein n=1 Tax=Anaerosphaera multitolerans TaxID=2487351 RepID=A0A437S8F1_9FIRM|nr:DNA alkylation repair protein [Anaerosphaera multitolerans]RVU55363.1 DNA alkylation repair protein [Anaerosphaera multitolerans]